MQSRFRRRDGTGHLDPAYEAMLRAGSGASSGHDHDLAFLGRPWSLDPLAEELAGEFVASATSGHDDAQALLDRMLPEEEGGPFVETSATIELAYE
jgi:hypothetical protein